MPFGTEIREAQTRVFGKLHGAADDDSRRSTDVLYAGDDD